MTEIFTAKTVDEAKNLAASKFGKNLNEIKFEIIEEGKKGFLGIGKTDAVVKATYDAPETVSKTVYSAEAAERLADDKKPQEAPVNAPEAPKTDDKNKSMKVGTPKIEEKSAAPAKKDSEKGDEYSTENFTLIEDESLVHPKVKIARDYIMSLLRPMGVDAKFNIYQNDEGAIINIDSDSNGTIIGRRGETLDAIQYLCSIIANKGDKDYFRITIDCFGYRKKRRETLEQLAVKVAKTVLKTGRSQPLEPMNPYERRVIHSAIAKIDGVSSRSVGEEPYRKIIISSNNPRKNSGKKFNDNRRNGGNNRRNHAKSHEPYEPKDIDLSTSFEKDYKKPKPEDEIEGGLYGKIEF